MKLPKASNILTRPLYLFCALAFCAAFFLPRSGLGITFCGFYNVTGFPCLGCGMTRAMGNIVWFDFEAAWSYHPFAFLLFPVMIVFGVAGLRRTWSTALHGWIIAHDPVLTRIFWGTLAGLIVFGIWRMFFFPEWMGHSEQFPLAR